MTTVPAKIGNDVYIRDSDDPTIQMKAMVYTVDFAAQTADVGFYPERDGDRFSQIHLPECYRAQGVPLSELSLEPHKGAAQKGYAEVLRIAGVPDSELGWMDSVGTMHTYMTKDEPEEDLPPGPDEVSIPAKPEEMFAVVGEAQHRGLSTAPAHVEASASPPVKPAKKTKAPAAVPPLFTKNDIIAKIKQLREEFDKLLDIAEKL